MTNPEQSAPCQAPSAEPTDAELRSRIMLATGWEHYPNPDDNPHCAMSGRRHRWFNTNDGSCYHDCPALTLDAMHEAEATLSDEEHDQYVCALREILIRRASNTPFDVDEVWLCTSAPARARALAFLRCGRAGPVKAPSCPL